MSLLQGGSSAMASSRPARISSSVPASIVCVCVMAYGMHVRNRKVSLRDCLDA